MDSRVGVFLGILERDKLNCAVRIGFKVTNNTVGYEAPLAFLRLATEMHVKSLLIYRHS